MRRYCSKREKIIRKVLILIIAIILILSLFVHYKIKKYIGVLCESSGRIYAENVINDAVNSVIGSADFSDVVSKNYNENEQIASISCNSIGVNMISSDISYEINKRISDTSSNELEIPMGTFTGVSFLSGKGPDVSIEISQIGSSEIKIISSFESAGINQTKYSLYADISLNIIAVMPTETVPVSVCRTVLLCEEIIVGDIPNFYIDKSE